MTISTLNMMGNISTVVNFANMTMRLLQSDDPAQGVLSLLGIDTGGPSEIDLLSTQVQEMHTDLVARLDTIHETTMANWLSDAQTPLHTAMTMLQGYKEMPTRYDTNEIVAQAEFGLTALNKTASWSIDVASSAEDLMMGVMAVQEALAIRMVVAKELQHGAFGMQTIHNQIAQSVDLLERAADKYTQLADQLEHNIRISIDEDALVTKATTTRECDIRIEDPTGNLSTDDLADMFVGRDGVEVVQSDDGFTLQATYTESVSANFGPKPELRIAVEDVPDPKLLNTFEQCAPREGDAFVIDPMDAIQRPILLTYLHQKAAEVALENAGLDQDPEMFRALGDVYDDVLDGISDIDDIGHAAQGAEALTGSEGNDFLQGHDNDDALYGFEDNDVLIGGKGADTLDGGAGADVLIGGREDSQGTELDGDPDVFVFRNPESVDAIKDFEARGHSSYNNVYGEMDTVQIDTFAFLKHADSSLSDTEIREMQDTLDAALTEAQTATRQAIDTHPDAMRLEDVMAATDVFAVGTHNVTQNTRLYQDGGKLYFDVDGEGALDAIHFATIENGDTLTALNFDFV